MGACTRGVSGVVMCGLGVLAALGTAGCSSDAKSPGCGTVAAPDHFTLIDVSPAAGTSVPNSGTVMSFTIVGQLIELMPALGLTAAHTAGLVTPNPVNWTITTSGQNSIYTSEQVVWATAPGHVEADIAGPFQDQATGCVTDFPKPVFSYDITAP